MEEQFSEDRRGFEKNGLEKARPVKRELEQRTQLNVSNLTMTMTEAFARQKKPFAWQRWVVVKELGASPRGGVWATGRSLLGIQIIISSEGALYAMVCKYIPTF